jgi:hypothetical protein
MDKPIFCTLSESEFAERRQDVLDSLKQKVLAVSKIPSGFAFEFPSNTEMSAEVHRAAGLEQQCCAFLSFNIDETGDRIRLEITGSDEAVRVIEEIFAHKVESRPGGAKGK